MKNSESSVSSSPEISLLSEYELWASQNWLHDIGSLDAQIHARAKFEEEIDELIEAISLKDAHDITSEAGDVLWTATASGHNSGISLSESLQATYPNLFLEKQIAPHHIDTVALEVFGNSNSDDIQQSLESYKIGLGKMAKQWFILKDVARKPAETFADAWIEVKRERTMQNLAHTALIVSFVAQQFAHSDLQHVIDMNHEKLNERLESGRAITKAPRI